jgi:hypothetical protein
VLESQSGSVRAAMKNPLFWAGSVGIVVISYLSLFESIRIASSINGPGYSETYFQLCIGMQPIALLSAVFLWKRKRPLAYGLLVGLFVTDIVIPILAGIYSIYVCSTGICPLGLAG